MPISCLDYFEPLRGMFLPLSSFLGRSLKHLLVVTWVKAKDFGPGIRRSCAFAALCERRAPRPAPRSCAFPTFAAAGKTRSTSPVHAL